MKLFLPLLFILSPVLVQHDHHTPAKGDSHLSHILASRQQTVYVHNLPPPALMDGIGKSELMIQTTSEKT